MPRATVSVLKFVGTVSLGLLTGISYTHTTLTFPTLTTLPSASTARRTFTHLLHNTRVQSDALLLLSISSYTLAFALSPPRGGRHPYLLWTSLIASIGWGVGRFLAAGSDFDRAEDSGKRGAKRVLGEDDDYIDATHSTAQLTPTSGSEVDATEGFGLHDNLPAPSARAGGLNGEQVRRSVEGFRSVEAVRAGFFGVGFLMGVVGIWGDGTTIRGPA